MLKTAVDVYYREATAKAVCILFEDWTSKDPFSTHVAKIEDVNDYEPGAFYKRELPCILKVLQQVNLALVDAVVVDGYVWLDENGRKGLGAYLYEALNKKLPVIGVAKTRFQTNRSNVVEVRRGASRNPLFVTAAGMDAAEAAADIQAMAGAYRVPALLQYLDKMTREE